MTKFGGTIDPAQTASSSRRLTGAVLTLAMILCGVLTGCGQSNPNGREREGAASRAASQENASQVSADAGPVAVDRVDQESGDQESSEVEQRQRSLAAIRRLISAGDRRSALEQLRAYQLLNPEDATAMILAAPLLQLEGRIDEAVAMFDAAASHAETDADQWSRRAALLLDQHNRWEEAIARLKTLVETHRDTIEHRHDLIAVLNRRGFRFDANEHVRALCRSGHATADQLRGLIYPTRSFNGLSEAPNAEAVAANHAIGELNVARAMYGEGDVQSAATVMKTSRLIEQRHPAAVAFYGQLLIESQQYDDFQSWLDTVEPGVQRYPAYWKAQGTWALRQRRPDVAIGCFLEALRKEPGDLATIDRICQSLAAIGRSAEQERFRQRGIMIDRMMTVARQWFAGGARDPALIDELARSLDEVGRPLEALAWYRVALRSQRASDGKVASDGKQAGGAMDRIDQAIALANEEAFQANSLRQQLCGLDQDQFPAAVPAVVAASTVDQDSGRRSVGFSGASESGAANASGIAPVFANVAQRSGLHFIYYNSEQQIRREFRLFEQLGAGVACLDYDLDGRVDFYLGQASASPIMKSAAGPGVAVVSRGTRPNVLARSLGDRFVTVTAAAGCDDRGYTLGVSSGDWNQDGFPDLVVGNLGVNSLWINQGDGTFHFQTGDDQWNRSLCTASVAMADVDGDHLPDMIEINYVDDPSLFHAIAYDQDGSPVRLPAPMDFRPAQDRVFYSDGDGGMTGRVLGNAERPSAATGLGVVVTDLVAGSGNEIYVANDRLPNQFWEPSIPITSPGRDQVGDGSARGDFQWHDTSAARGVAYGAMGAPQGSMGIAVADFDHNGRLDMHVTNFEAEWNNQYMQDQTGYFEDLVVASGLDRLTYPLLGFGVQALDYDNNGETDLVIANGHVEDYSKLGKRFEMPTTLLMRLGSRFVHQTVGGDDGYWDSGHLSRALARCDWNSDGRMDFAVTDLLQPFALLENQTQTPYHTLQLQLIGTAAERDAIGAVVTVKNGDRSQTQAVQSGDGYMCRNQAILGFGIGHSRSVDVVEIRWPDGQLQSLGPIEADRCWLVIQSQQEVFQLSRFDRPSYVPGS